MDFNLITILGPTAVGKTKLAAKLAYHFNGEIISADSRQVYKDMDIGTGKDYDDYIINQTGIPFHLLDIKDPSEDFDVFQFKELFFSSYKKIVEAEKTPFLVGGSGMYLSAVIQNYSLPKAEFNSNRAEELESKSADELKDILFSLRQDQHNTTDILKKQRLIKAIIIAESDHQKSYPLISSLNIGIIAERELIKKRITERLKLRLQNGMIEEVEKLLKSGVSLSRLKYFGLEYKFIGMYLSGELNYNDMFQKLNSAIHSFAKRQMTWFRKMEKEGVKINWITNNDFNKAEELIVNHYK